VNATDGAWFYRIRLVKSAPYSALKIWHGFPIDNVTGELLFSRYPIWRAILNGEHVPIEDVMVEIDGITKRPVIKGEEIDDVEYFMILKRHLWARAHAPDSPEANPAQKVDLNKIRTIF
jgi:hypothetical protein